jgi:predicted Rossmann fold flavoprotein
VSDDRTTTFDVIVVGAGAAGLFCAITAAEQRRRVLLLEKNRRPGVKILMSGGTRCNLTQNTNARGIAEAYGDQGRFLHSALATLSPQQLVAWFEAEGVPTKIEETNKIFPVSDRAADVVEALVQALHRTGATLALEEPVTDIALAADGFAVQTPRRTLTARSVVVTTGGLSYPGSGTTGDGFAWAQRLGHTIVPTRPALTPLTTNDRWVQELSGLTIPDVSVQVRPAEGTTSDIPALAQRRAKGIKRGVLAEQRGSFLFTHFGLSGPAVLDVSRAVTSHPSPSSLILVCDFLPDVSREALEEQMRSEWATDGRKHALAVVARLVPRRLAESLFARLGLTPELRGAEVSKRDRVRLATEIKQTQIHLSGALGYKKAEVTAGGVSLAEVDSRTMQSKLVSGLFFAGEVLDLDGPIGGYNFQAAFATGRLAGLHV